MVAPQLRELGYWCIRTNPINAFVHCVLTFIAGTSVSDLDTSMRCSVNPQPLNSILQQVWALARGVLCAPAYSVESRHSSSVASSQFSAAALPVRIV